MPDEFSYLNITSLAADLVEDQSDCGFGCLETSSCFSYNLAAFPDINGKLLCELLPSDKYNHTDKLVPSNSFHHYSIVVSEVFFFTKKIALDFLKQTNSCEKNVANVS